MDSLNWYCKKFSALSVTELYEIMKLRSEVFVIEQQCIYLDADDKDLASYHLFALQNGSIAAYARLLPPGLAFTEASIGRVLTANAHRKKGYGRLLIQEAKSQTQVLFTTNKITIGAQLYLKKFYEDLGFVQTSNVYEEDCIKHIEMEFDNQT